jgi:hypothetical protein
MAIIKPSSKFKGQRMPFGKHKNALIETVVLKHPDFIDWLTRKDQLSAFEWVYEHMNDCVTIFDKKPLVNASCSGNVDAARCKKPATRFSLAYNSTSIYYWCDDCDAYQLGANGLTEARGYHGALFHVRGSIGRRRADYRTVIKSLLKAKGLKGNLTDRKIVKFLYGADAEPARVVDEDE